MVSIFIACLSDLVISLSVYQCLPQLAEASLRSNFESQNLLCTIPYDLYGTQKAKNVHGAEVQFP